MHQKRVLRLKIKTWTKNFTGRKTELRGESITEIERETTERREN